MQLRNIDEKILFFLKDGDKKRKDILVFLRGEDSKITDHQLRRSLERLSDQDLIKRKRYSVYGLTEEGKARTEGLSLETESLFEYKEIAKTLKLLPLHLRAFTILYLCGIIARRYLRAYYEEGFPSFLTFGEKSVGKTGCIRVAFRLLHLEFEKHSRYLPNATPGELGLRHFREKGEERFTAESSFYFDKPAFCFEELGKAGRLIKNAVWVYFQSNRKYSAEKKEFPHKVCAVATSNIPPQKIKIPPGIPRRTPMLNTDAIGKELEDIDLVLRKLQKGRLPYLNLSKLKPKFNKLTDRPYNLLRTLLKNCVTDYAWNYKVDIQSTVILSLAMQALSRTDTIEPAILFTLYYRLLLLETTDDTVENWKDILFARWKKIDGFQKDIEVEKEITQVSPVAPENIKVAKEQKKIQDKVRIPTEFEPQHKEITDLVDKTINEIQNVLDGVIWQFFTPEEQEKFNIALRAFNVLKKIGNNIKKGDWKTLKAFKREFSNTEKDQYLPLIELFRKGNQRRTIQATEKCIEPYMALPEDKWNHDKWNSLKDLDVFITNNPTLEEEQKRRLKESFPKIYYEMPDRFKAAEEARQRSAKEEREASQRIADTIKAVLDTKTPIPPTTPSPQRTIPSPKPIGTAELFHTTFHRWIKAEIWDKKYDDPTGEEKYYVKWENGKQSGWVKNTQLRQISYFGQ